MSPLEMAEAGTWADFCMSLIYARAWRERQEELDRQLQEFLRPHDEVEELKSQ